MALKFYGHPFSSYTQKALIALYENAIPFDYLILGPDHPENAAEWAALWPVRHFPVLVDNGAPIMEATIIIEHLGLYHPGPVQLIPPNARAALPVRMMDRFFDNYIMSPMQRIVANALRPDDAKDETGVQSAKAMLDTAYAWLDTQMDNRQWGAGDLFTLADCAAAPSLFYADWAHPLADRFPNVTAYRQRLLARPSFARAVDEARPYRPLFPVRRIAIRRCHLPVRRIAPARQRPG